MDIVITFCIGYLLWLIISPNNRLKIENRDKVLSIDEKRTKPLLKALDSEYKWKGVSYALIIGVLLYICVADNPSKGVAIIDQEGIKRFVSISTADSLIREGSAYLAE